jgi:RNA polymerase sigma-70 factor (ECF subfamily)
MEDKVASDSALNINPDHWIDRYSDGLYRYALTKVKDPADAQDLVQETFLAGLHARSRFRGQASEKTWLISILRHKIVDYFRRKSRERPVENTGLITDDASSYFKNDGHWRIKPGKWSANPVKIYRQKEFLRILYQCLARLPERLAKAFIMREMEGLETDEICKALDISATNSWVMLYRARMALRHCIEVNWLNEQT